MNVIITTDDLCLSYLDNFKYFDELKEKFKNLKVIAFTIANYKNNEKLLGNSIFEKWYQEHKNWVEIAVHSYDHDGLPDGDREDEKEWISKALEGLKPYLPKDFGYRSPGWQTTNKTVSILQELGFSYIAYETKFKNIKNNQIVEAKIINSHLYDLSSIKRIKELLYEIS